MKIIHIVENLDKGAVENWLVNVFIESRKINPEWEWTFYCILGKPGRLDEKVITAGGKIIYSPCTISSKLSFLKALRRVLKAGNYDIIHSHHDYLSGFYLLASHGLHFKKRLLHIHNTDKALPVGNALLRRFLLWPFRWLGFYYSDYIVGISQDALHQFVKKRKAGKKQYCVLYYGVDFSKFEKPVDAHLLKKNFSIPIDAKTLLFIGRMNKYKNPAFVVDVLAALLQKRNDVYALFVGDGDELEIVKNKAQQYNIFSNIRCVGWQDDAPAIMKAANVFIFPRLAFPKEGLGLTVVEAQAAGLTLFITNGIVEDALIVKELIHCLNLNNNADEWASEINAVFNNVIAVNKVEALLRMKQSPFELNKATQNLLALYE